MAKRARRSRKVSDAPTGIAPDSAPAPVAPLTFAADHAGSSADVTKTVVPVSVGAQLRRSAAPAPPLPPHISPPEDVDPDDDDDDTDEQPAPTQTVEPATAIDTPPTPVEVAAEPTDEEMPPLPVILDALFGPSTGKPRELVMADPPPVATPVQPDPDPEEQTMPTQTPPVSPGPRENDPISKQMKTFGIICVIGIPAAMLIGLNFKNPLTPHPAEVAANVAATKIADATPPRPAEVPTPPSDEDASAPSDEAVAADVQEEPATPEPTAELVPSAGMGGPTIVLPVAPPVVAAVAPPASKPSVVIPAAKLAAPAPVAATVAPIPVAKTTAVPVATVAPPVIKVALTTPVAKPAAATVPATILVSATGKHPGCTAPCAWGNVDPADAYPYTVDGKRVVTCGDATYTVGKWTRINDGPQTYCYTVSDVTAN